MEEIKMSDTLVIYYSFNCFKDYETLVKGNIKGKLDLLFSANDGERDKMLTTNAELDKCLVQMAEVVYQEP